LANIIILPDNLLVHVYNIYYHYSSSITIHYHHIVCPSGTYNPNNGSTTLSACLLCSAGTYNSHQGSNSSDACNQCPANTFNPFTGRNSSLECQTCPLPLPVAPPGSAMCYRDTKCLLSTITIVGGNVGSIPLLLIVPFFCFGGLIFFIRSRSSNVEAISLLSVIISISIAGLDFLSDGVFLVFLLSGIISYQLYSNNILIIIINIRVTFTANSRC